MSPLNRLILQLADVFERLEISHAFGGALANSYWGVVRTTQDADCLVSVPAIQFQQLADELNDMGCVIGDSPAIAAPVTVAELRKQIDDRKLMAVFWNSIRADLFVPIVPLQNEVLRRAVLMPFEDREIKVTTAEDLVLLKMVFHRQKDLQDVRGILHAQRQTLDRDYLGDWGERTLEDSTMQELESLIQQYVLADDD